MGQDRVLVAMPLAHDHVDTFAPLFEERGVGYEVPERDEPLTAPELRDRIGDHDGVMVGFTGVDGETIAAADRLRVISQWGIGLDGVDLEAAEAAGIAVYNTPGAFAAEIADVVIAMLTMLTRELHRIDRSVREGQWPALEGVSLDGKTLGILGVGDIGSAVARRASAHGMDLIGHDVEPLENGLVEETGIQPVSRPALFDRAFAVSVNCPLTPATRNLVGAEELDRLGPDGYLLNTARGEIVDEDALVDALADGRLAGAGLDVFETEPLPADHPLTGMEQVVLGSHNAGHTREAVRETTRRAAENLLAGLSEQTQS